MTDTNRPEGTNDPSDAPEYEQLGEAGNPFSGKDQSSSNDQSSGDDQSDKAGLDQVASGGGAASDDDQNAPLPDWGPTDGTPGVDGSDEAK